jgi:hypothetical protein
MDALVGDVITIVRVIYAAVDGMKTNSAARSLLLTKLDAIQAIIASSISDPPPAHSPTASALSDLQDTLRKALDTIKKQEKRGAFQRMVKHALEDADLIRLGDRVSQCQQQLAVAIAADNANQKIEVHTFASHNFFFFFGALITRSPAGADRCSFAYFFLIIAVIERARN